MVALEFDQKLITNLLKCWDSAVKSSIVLTAHGILIQQDDPTISKHIQRSSILSELPR